MLSSPVIRTKKRDTQQGVSFLHKRLIIDDQIEENGETTIEDILEIIKGPDFPTGAEILGTRGIEEAYRTGRGKIRVRAVTDIEPMSNGKQRIARAI